LPSAFAPSPVAVDLPPMALALEPKALDETPVALALLPTAVAEVLAALALTPRAVDLSLFAIVAAPFAVDSSPVAAAPLPLAVELVPLAVAGAPGASHSVLTGPGPGTHWAAAGVPVMTAMAPMAAPARNFTLPILLLLGGSQRDRHAIGQRCRRRVGDRQDAGLMKSWAG
jgi:hypothetical protein